MVEQGDNRRFTAPSGYCKNKFYGHFRRQISRKVKFFKESLMVKYSPMLAKEVEERLKVHGKEIVIELLICLILLEVNGYEYFLKKNRAQTCIYAA